MENQGWKRVLRWFVLGLVLAVAGLFVASLFGTLFNGMEYGDAVCLGFGVYLCVVVVTCVGVILSYTDKK
ncbi:MAG TPA: hypothetical protein IAC25_01675 [Candidatus Enterenecus stercoripullorum]|nr:hypothetical protein [Candidatus Enterenecus stercoripullorum]